MKVHLDNCAIELLERRYLCNKLRLPRRTCSLPRIMKKNGVEMSSNTMHFHYFVAPIHSSIYLSTYLPIYLPTYLSTYLPVYLSIIHLAIHLSIHLSIHRSIYRSINLSIYPSLHTCMHTIRPMFRYICLCLYSIAYQASTRLVG